MSILSHSAVQALNEEQMRKTGYSLGMSLYRHQNVILLRGELGAGKTTFVQGFAKGIGIQKQITSPTYPLEQRYDERLSHIDLYRLSEHQAAEFMRTLDPFPGIRIIEWSERVEDLESDMKIHITEEKFGRNISVSFSDINIPSEEMISNWMNDVCLPLHIQHHTRKVAEVCDMVADSLLQHGRIIRKDVLYAAALTHDLLRFVDFASLTGDANYSPTPRESEIWKVVKEKYGVPHEKAAEKFLCEYGFTDIGRIIRTHRGYGKDSIPETIEQFALCYADKRVCLDKLVSIDERFDDFMNRYGKGKESKEALAWRKEMKRIENFLFPEGTAF